MTPVVKPTRRGPKPRTRLKRSTVPLRRGCPPRRTTRPRPMAKGPRAAMEREAWRLSSAICRKLAGYSCVRCTVPGHEIFEGGVQLAAAHVIRRGYEAIKNDQRNLLCLCDDCHRFLREAPPGKESRMKAFYVERFGAAAFAEMERLAGPAAKFDPRILPLLRIRATLLGIG